MQENPDQSQPSESEHPALSTDAIKSFDRQLLIGLAINLGMFLLATLVLDGGRTARFYVPFCAAHLVVSLMLWLRAKRSGMKWTAVDLYLMRMGPPLGFLAALFIASPRS